MYKNAELFTFSLIVIAVVFTLSCSTENPLCTDNFCVEGEIYRKSDLPRGAEFSQLAVDDDAVLAAFVDIPNVRSRPTANFMSVTPRGGEVAANGTITVTFDNVPTDVTASHGTVIVEGKTARIRGPFPPGKLALTVAWTDGVQALNYTVTGPDPDPPVITQASVRDGETNVDPKEINDDEEIVVWFSENVSGHIALQTEGGDDLGWIGRVEGNKATLKLVIGKDLDYETIYVIKVKVSDAADNPFEFSITFQTKGQ